MFSQSVISLSKYATTIYSLISPNAKPPVCKIMDYGKYRFEQNKKVKEAKKNHASQEELDELTNSFRVFKKKSKVFVTPWIFSYQEFVRA